jgi:hypothetical protein
LHDPAAPRVISATAAKTKIKAPAVAGTFAAAHA